MKLEQVKAFMGYIGSSPTGYRAGWVEGHCPYGPWKHGGGVDHHPSFAIKADDTKKSIYKCFSCGMGGDLMSMMVSLGEMAHQDPHHGMQLGKALQLAAQEMEGMEFDPNLPDYSEAPTLKKDDPYPEVWWDSFKPAGGFSVAMGYLVTRQFSLDLLEALDVRYDPVRNRICFPFRNPKGELMGVQGRLAKTKLKSDELRYYFYPHPSGGVRNMHVWMGEDHLDLDKPVVLVEGPFDYASVYRVYQNVLASFSAGVSEAKLKRLSDATDIITFYDTGKGGDQARKKISKVLKGVPITDVIPENDLKDAGDMTVDEVRYHLKDHLPWL